jgi:hypothetical protein
MSRSLLVFKNSVIPYLTPSIWRAAVNFVTDADTIWVERDTGCRDQQLIEIRVTGYPSWRGFNAAERFTPDGKILTGVVNQLAAVGSVVRIETKPDTEKYGRWLSPILMPLQSVVNLIHPEADVTRCCFTIDRVVYVDLASYLVANVQGAVWQIY